MKKSAVEYLRPMSPDMRRLLKFINKTAKEVAKWPAWMKGSRGNER